MRAARQPSSVVRNFLIQELRQAACRESEWSDLFYGLGIDAVWLDGGGSVLLSRGRIRYRALPSNSAYRPKFARDRAPKVAIQKTDIDVPAVTQWSLIDLADAVMMGSGCHLGRRCLRGPLARSCQLQTWATPAVFSGLGYWL